MRLIDAIQHVKRDQPGYAPCDPICDSLSLNCMSWFPDELGKRLVCYPIYNWMCTDEHVGLDAIYLDGEPVGCSYRPARKSDYEIEWISTEIADRVRTVIASYREHDPVTVLNPDQDIGEDFCTNGDSALTDDGLFEGRPIRVLVWYSGFRNTPKEYRRAGRAYSVKVPYNHPHRDCVLVQDGDQPRLIRGKDFRQSFNVELPR